MSLFSRAHDIVAAKTNRALDSAENPNEMLDYSYEQMLDHLTKVRQALVDIATARKRIELQEQQLQHTVGHLQDQAQGAVARGREDLAREALSRKAAAQQQIDDMGSQHQELTEQEQKLEQTLSELQQRVGIFRSQKEVMKARAGAMDELLQSGVLEDVGGDTDDIQQELDAAGSAAGVDKELAAMKTKLAISPAAI
jgi:phage shock protein A